MRLDPTIVLCLLFPTSAAAQSTWFVDVSAAGPGTGSAVDPYPSIQQAIDAPSTSPGDEILVAPGTYLESLDPGGKAVALIGDPASRPSIRGNGLERYVQIVSGEGPEMRLENFEFVGGTGGSTGTRGGAVLVENSHATFVGCRFFANRICGSGGAVGGVFADLTFLACEFENNQALTGGAVSALAGSLIVRDGSFEGNTGDAFPGCSGGSASGGAISSDDAQVEIVDSSFVGNFSGRGAAVALSSNPGGELVARCVFSSNGSVPIAQNGIEGGAVYAGGYTLEDCDFIGNGGRRGGAAYEGTYRNCRFTGNAANYGGAAYQAQLFDCDVWNNHAVESNGNDPEGGGTHSCHQTRCVFWGNTAALGAGACANSQLVDRCTIVGNLGFADCVAVDGSSLLNSIVWGNRSISPVGPVTMVDVTNLAFSMVEGDPSTIAGPPLLFGRHVGDAHLLPGSPAIDAASGALPLDPDGSPADIGARTYDPTYRAAPSRFCDPKRTSSGCSPEIGLVGTVSLSGPPARVEVYDVPHSTLGLLLLSSDAQGVAFFGGTLCVGGTIRRAGAAVATAATGCGDRLEFPLGASEVGIVGLDVGDLLFAQVWFRDSSNPDGTGVGVSDALVATVEP